MTSEQLVNKLLELTGATKLGKQMLDQMATDMGKMRGLPPGFIERAKANAHPEDLTALIVPIYVREVDHDTLLAAVRFYETKEGQALIAKLPALTKASMEAGRQWGAQIARKTLAEMGVAAPAAPTAPTAPNVP